MEIINCIATDESIYKIAIDHKLEKLWDEVLESEVVVENVSIQPGYSSLNNILGCLYYDEYHNSLPNGDETCLDKAIEYGNFDALMTRNHEITETLMETVSQSPDNLPYNIQDSLYYVREAADIHLAPGFVLLAATCKKLIEHLEPIYSNQIIYPQFIALIAEGLSSLCCAQELWSSSEASRHNAFQGVSITEDFILGSTIDEAIDLFSWCAKSYHLDIAGIIQSAKKEINDEKIYFERISNPTSPKRDANELNLSFNKMSIITTQTKQI